MGVWGNGAFENDAANDWSSDLVEQEDLSFVTETLSSAQDVDDDELDVEVGFAALAACEVIARLQGRAGRRGATGDPVDQWVRAHPLRPSPAIVQLATSVLDRVTTSGDLADTYRKDAAWVAQVHDLRRRLAGPSN